MRYILIVIGTLVALGVLNAFPSNYDNVDPYEWFGNPIFFKAGLGCFLGILPCDPVNGFYNKYAPEVFYTGGSKMTDSQKRLLVVFYQMGYKYYPYLIKGFDARYDPTGKLKPMLMKTLERYVIHNCDKFKIKPYECR